METEDLKEKVEDLTSHVSDYLDTLYRLTLLKITQKATNLASTIVTTIAVCTLGLIALFFASIGVAWWLGDIIKSRAGGFFIIAGFYLLLVFCIVLLRKKIVFPYIRKLVLGKIYE
jgi:Putative Actinobacterial Holin-X, holin superfamily III